MVGIERVAGAAVIRTSWEVSAREYQRVAVDGTHAADDAVSPGPDLLGGLPFQSAIAEQLPVGALGMDLDALLLAEVQPTSGGSA
jgi:hypothetical protein